MATTATTKPQLSALQTPVSATYPSELRSPMVGTPTYIKKEELDMKTPITPPAAYLDFLKTLSPVLMSPMTTGTRMSFGEPSSSSNQPRSNSIESISLDRSSSTPKPEPTSEKEKDATSEKTPKPASRRPSCSVNSKEPASRNNSTTSISTVSTTTSTTSTESISSDASSTVKPSMKIIIPPPAPSPHTFTRPHSARTPRGRLQNPMSPFSPVARTPLSATARTPLSSTASAYSGVFSPYSTSTTSPRDWELEKRAGEGKSTVRQVSVRQVVTRTVMYTRTPVVDPVPASKRRKTEHVVSKEES